MAFISDNGLVGRWGIALYRRYMQGKKNKPCLRGYSFLQAFALCWLKTIRRLSRVGCGHFHLFTIRWFPLVPLPLPPSTFPRITLWMSRPLLGNDSMRHGATQSLCLHTHTRWKVWQTWWNSRLSLPPCAHPTHPGANSITMRPLIRPKHRRGGLPQSRTPHLLLFVPTSLVTTMVMWWRGGLNLPFPLFFHFPFFL